MWNRAVKALGFVEKVSYNDVPKLEGETKEAWEERAKLHVRSRRTGFPLHELRDLFRTQWSKSKSNADVGEFLMGHVIDKNNYNKIGNDLDEVLQEYKHASRWLNVWSDKVTPFGLASRDEIEELKAESETLKEDLRDFQAFKELYLEDPDLVIEQMAQERAKRVKKRMREILEMDPEMREYLTEKAPRDLQENRTIRRKRTKSEN